MSSNFVKRTNEEWVADLKDSHNHERQNDAYNQLSSYLFTVAYNYLEARKDSVDILAYRDRQELGQWAKDFVQDTLEKMVINNFALLETFRREGSFLSWASVILRNLTATRLAKLRRERLSVLDETDVDDNLLPDKYILRHEVLTIIYSCITKLPKRRRIAFQRCIVEGESAFSVATDSETTPNAIYQLVYHAKRDLRDCILGRGIKLGELISDL